MASPGLVESDHVVSRLAEVAKIVFERPSAFARKYIADEGVADELNEESSKSAVDSRHMSNACGGGLCRKLGIELSRSY